tara:strand:+ start:310 stop:534 length:225 start_codon:yes stop_codon:yes gene_type:complete
MSEVKLYTLELTSDELSIIRAGLRRSELKNKEEILDYRKYPERAENEDFKKWHVEEVETTMILMELREKLYNVE